MKSKLDFKPMEISIGDKPLLFSIVLCRSMAYFITKGYRLVDI